MSSDEEDIDLNDEATSQLETITDDGGEIMDIEGKAILFLSYFSPFFNSLKL